MEKQKPLTTRHSVTAQTTDPYCRETATTIGESGSVIIRLKGSLGQETKSRCLCTEGRAGIITYTAIVHVALPLVAGGHPRKRRLRYAETRISFRTFG